jgi:hypothetical protein
MSFAAWAAAMAWPQCALEGAKVLQSSLKTLELEV